MGTSQTCIGLDQRGNAEYKTSGVLHGTLGHARSLSSWCLVSGFPEKGWGPVTNHLLFPQRTPVQVWRLRSPVRSNLGKAGLSPPADPTRDVRSWKRRGGPDHFPPESLPGKSMVPVTEEVGLGFEGAGLKAQMPWVLSNPCREHSWW